VRLARADELVTLSSKHQEDIIVLQGLFNATRAKQYMRELNLDALVATTSVNVRYFSGYSCWMDSLFKEYMMRPGAPRKLAQPSYAVFPIDGAPALIIKSLMAVNALDLEISDLRLYGESGVDYSLLSSPGAGIETRFLMLLRDTPRSETAIDALAACLRDRRLDDTNVGVEMEGLPSEEQAALSRALPQARFRDCTDLIRYVRAVKTQEEIRLLTNAAEIAEQAAMESLAMARVGGRASDLVHHFQLRLVEQGAIFDHFSFSLDGLGICQDLGRAFRADDVIYVDFGCIFSPYFSDSGTTLAFSDLSPEMARRYGALQSCIAAGAHAMRPGVKASAIQETMNEVLKESGIVEAFPHGHGMGLELRDYPILVPANGLRIRDDCIDIDSDLTMEEGMVNNLEAPLFLPLAGSLHIERSFVVGADGSHELCRQDRTHPYLAA
jgi:Xaa-Pro dipeptidase